MAEGEARRGCSADEAVVAAVGEWLAAGHPVFLVTVLTTWGSSPRPPGSLLAVRADGSTVGSVSGGCVEDDLVDRLRAGAFPEEQPARTRYGVTRDTAARFGLPCGGALELLVEPLAPERDGADWQALRQALAAGRRVRRWVAEGSGEVRLTEDEAEAPEVVAEAGAVAKRFGPRWRLLIIGAGQLGAYLAQYAGDLGYGITVCDPRPGAVADWTGGAISLETGMPDHAVAAFAPDARSAVVTTTHDPKLDDMALLEALPSPAFYIGALGSQRNNDRRRERLAELGLTPEAVARLHGPMGLAIGSRTPPEIALAVAAEMTAVRHGRAAASGP